MPVRKRNASAPVNLPSVDHALARYLALGQDRTLEKARAALAAETPPWKVSLKTLKRWCAKGGWTAKAEAEDRRIKAETNLRIAEKVAETVADAAVRLGISHGYILESLKQVADRCMQAEPVLDDDGKPTGEYKFDAKGAVAALKLMGETIATFQAGAPPPPPPADGQAVQIAREVLELVREYAPHTPTLDLKAQES